MPANRAFIFFGGDSEFRAEPVQRPAVSGSIRKPFTSTVRNHRSRPPTHKAVLRRPLKPGQFVSIRYTERLAEAGIDGSVGSRGDSYDNTLAESFNGLYKTELVYHEGPWKNADNRRVGHADVHPLVQQPAPSRRNRHTTTRRIRNTPTTIKPAQPKRPGPNKNSLYQARGYSIYSVHFSEGTPKCRSGRGEFQADELHKAKDEPTG